MEGTLDVLVVLLFSTLVMLSTAFVGCIFSEVAALLPLFDSGPVTEKVNVPLC
jgi:hypothetical protein